MVNEMADNRPAQPITDEVDTSTPTTVSIIFPDASASNDDSLVTLLASVVNAVYDEVERDLFVPGYHRTNNAEIKGMLSERELAVAYLCPSNEPVGCVSIKKLSPERGQFGMLALHPSHQGSGFGRLLVSFAEEHCRSEGCTVMQLELLVPTYFTNPSKKRMEAWYRRLGYEVTKHGDFSQDYPHIAALLAGPTEYRIFEKGLTT